jgi:uncharacterized membrane protein
MTRTPLSPEVAGVIQPDALRDGTPATRSPAAAANELKPRYKRFWLIVTCAGILLGIVFRTAHLGRQSLWLDEGYTAWMVSHPPQQIVDLIRADTAPPGYYLLLHYWTALVGNSEIALRLPSAVFSIAAMVIALDIARRLLRNRAAVAITAWALALSYVQVRYAREARAYAFMGLLAVAAFDSLLMHLRCRHLRWVAVFPVQFALMMYIHNMMAPYIVAILASWVILPSHRTLRQRLTEITVVSVGAFIFYLPWALTGLPSQLHTIQHGFWVGPLSKGQFSAAVATLMGISRFESWSQLFLHFHLTIGEGNNSIVLAGYILTTSGLLRIIHAGRSERREAAALLTVAILPLVLAALYGMLLKPLFMVRLFIPSASLLPIFILLPMTVKKRGAMLPAAWSGAALLILFTALTLYGYYIEYFKEDWRQVAGIVSQLPAERRLIVFVANDAQLPFDYYYHYRPGDEVTGIPAGFFDLNPPRTMQRIPQDGDLGKLESQLDSTYYDQIVLIEERVDWADPQESALRYLKSRWLLTTEEKVRSLDVRTFVPQPISSASRP